MSESNITIAAKFIDFDSAQKIETIMQDALQKITEALNNGEDTALHEYLDSKNLCHGMYFDSWWIPESVERNDNVLHLKLIGSPSGWSEEQEEDDMVVWLKKCGAESISGELVIDGGGDVEVQQL